MRAVGATGRTVTLAGRPSAVSASGVVGYPSSGSGRGEPGGGTVHLVRRADGSTPSMTYAQIARANPWVVGSIGRRANPAASVDLHVFRPVRDGRLERVRWTDTGPGADLAWLLNHPDEGTSSRRWRSQLLHDRLVHGNTTIQKVYAGSRIVALRWRPFVDAKPDWTEDGLRVDSWSWPTSRSPWGGGSNARSLMPLPASQAGDERDFVAARDTIHVTLNEDTESPLGLSPLAPLHSTHALHDAVMRFAVNYLADGVFPSGAFELPANITPEQVTVARELINDLKAGPDRAGAPFIGFGKWQQISSTPEAAKLLDLAEWSREEVSAAYDVPLSSLTSSATNRAQSNQDRERFLRDVIGSDVDGLVTELQTQLVATEPAWADAGIVIKPNMWDLLRPDAVALAGVIQAEVGGPVATPNEGRQWVGLPPLDDPMADRLILNPGTPGHDDASATDSDASGDV